MSASSFRLSYNLSCIVSKHLVSLNETPLIMYLYYFLLYFSLSLEEVTPEGFQYFFLSTKSFYMWTK